MKLVLQIALGVFLGTLASQLSFEAWQARRELAAQTSAAKFEAEKERTRRELSERVRALLLRGRQENQAEPRTPPPSFIPDDAELQPPKEN